MKENKSCKCNLKKCGHLKLCERNWLVNEFN